MTAAGAHGGRGNYPNGRRLAQRELEIAMPLIYLPLILYTGWMELMLQPLRTDAPDGAVGAADEVRSEAAP